MAMTSSRQGRHGCERKNGMKRAVACHLVTHLGGLANGEPAAVPPRPQQDAPRLLIARDDMQAVLKGPERARVGRAARPVAQFLDVDPGFRVDAGIDRRVLLQAGIDREGSDLDKDRILHLDRFIVCPAEGDNTCAEAD